MNLPRAYGEAVLRAKIRSTPDDFLVQEIDAFEASGSGEHLLLRIRKRGLTTGALAKKISQWAKIPEMGVSYAGMKDRHAVTEQRFSVHFPKKVAPDTSALQTDDIQILDACWHAKKLPKGALAGNRFVLCLRDVQGERAAIEERLERIKDSGVPNYFGEQRFGREGDNVEQAIRMFAGARVNREQRSILLSAARSEIFNQVLAERIQRHNWNQACEGDVWMLQGTHSIFGPEPLTSEIHERLQTMDIHPTGPQAGAGPLRSQGEIAVLEQSIFDAHSKLLEGLIKAGLKQERRSLRLKIDHLSWRWLDERSLALSFELPPGAYATSMLHELGECS
jgi:tRNA pseudouridine13 synthase